MPPKKNYKFEPPKSKKTKTKNKPPPPPPAEEPKKDEEEKTEGRVTGTVPKKKTHGQGKHKKATEVENLVTAAGELSLGEPAKSAAKFKQVEIPGRGQGLVATARLPVGTIVIEESPLVTAKDNGLSSFCPYDVKEIVAGFKRLTDEQKNEVLSLHDPGPNSVHGKLLQFSNGNESEKKVARIFAANCIALNGHQEMDNFNMSGLYKTISRINHSCAPNVVWCWIKGDKSKSVKQVRVCREIQEGEEILATYIEPIKTFPSREERQQNLKSWNFTCDCEVCALTGDELLKNERARERMRFLHTAARQAHLCSIEMAYNMAKEKVALNESMKKEMIVNLPFALMECYELAVYCKLPNSRLYMKKAKAMFELFGDQFVHGYTQWMKSVERNKRLPLAGGGDDDCRIM